VLTARGLLAPGALDVRDLLDLVAVGTVADMVPLLGDNRILVAAGLKRLNEAARPGLAALKAVSGVDGKPVTAGTVAFALAPRLNATGRLGDPRAALALLRASDDLDARRHAETLQRDNDERRLVAQRVVDEAMTRVAVTGGPAHRIVVVWGEGWHPGVVGIAAARLLDAFGRPAVVIGVENGVGKGSCRSVRGFDIGRALESAAPLLERFGGHPMAAGLTVRSGRIPELAAMLEALADASVDDDALVPTIALDAWIGLDELATTLADDVARMQPFGMGNPEPVLAVRDVVLSNARMVGKDRSHVQIEVDDGRRRCDGIWFGGATAVATIGDRVDVAFSVARDERTGAARMKVRDMRPAGTAGADTEAT
jgi:single-stranded-DNA-specific exonuclease